MVKLIPIFLVSSCPNSTNLSMDIEKSHYTKKISGAFSWNSLSIDRILRAFESLVLLLLQLDFLPLVCPNPLRQKRPKMLRTASSDEISPVKYFDM